MTEKLDADTMSDRLLDGAGKIFAEKGFKHATVREIMQAVGIKNLAAINYYFGDKEGLYNAALRHAFQRGIANAPLPGWPAGVPAKVKLTQLIYFVLTRMLGANITWQADLLMRELQNPSPAGRELVQDFIRPLYELFWNIVTELVPAGTGAEKIHLVAFSIIGQCFYHRVAQPVIRLVVGEDEIEGYTVDKLAEHITGFTLAALKVG